MLNPRIAEILRSGKPEQTLVVQGWVRTKRELKGFAFLEVNLSGLDLFGNQRYETRRRGRGTFYCTHCISSAAV